MQVRRRGQQWLVRWPLPRSTSTGAGGGDHSAASCLFCDDAREWIELKDFVPMPAPTLVRECVRCGTVTAIAAYAITSRTWGDAMDPGRGRSTVS